MGSLQRQHVAPQQFRHGRRLSESLRLQFRALAVSVRGVPPSKSLNEPLCWLPGGEARGASHRAQISGKAASHLGAVASCLAPADHQAIILEDLWYNFACGWPELQSTSGRSQLRQTGFFRFPSIPIAASCLPTECWRNDVWCRARITSGPPSHTHTHTPTDRHKRKSMCASVARIAGTTEELRRQGLQLHLPELP